MSDYTTSNPLLAFMSAYCSSGGGGTPKVCMLFQSAEAAQAAHKWLLEAQRGAVETTPAPCEHDWTPWGMPGPASHCRKCGKWAEWPQVNGSESLTK